MFTLLDVFLPAPVCPCLWHDFKYMLFYWDLSIHVCMTLHATWHSSYHLLGSFLTPLGLHVQISEL